ncbi:MAG TPA: ABC transporter permease [Stackebrandtia sp.]|jgi:rhamnose transport system permease protein|uniref:ABC transporter permease n=1 Tax=Stackebrandtia sp. TaxID=2023065 RepID=UPI002D70D78D|nr:ABC transporter permease [Stackebrandtia sp.]HZE40128.1 ABC transporter permease [Stackebrandtia sp.]
MSVAPTFAKRDWPLMLVRRREFGVVAAVVVLVTVTTVINPGFAIGSDGFRNLLLTPSLLVILAVAQAIVIITKNVDLSVSAVLGLTAYATGLLFTDVPGAPLPLVVVAGIGLGAVLGAVNGFLVSVARVPSLVITLGTLYIYRGIDVAWAGSDRINATDLPSQFTALGTASLLGIPVMSIVAVAVVAIAAYVMSQTRAGRQMYAIGSNGYAAQLYGLAVRRTVFIGFVASGTLAGLAGVLFAARYATVSSNAGFGMELQAVAAAVLGGVAIVGGIGTVLGAALGAVLLTTISRALPTLGIGDFWQQAVLGALIIGAIVLDRAIAARQARRLRSAHARAAAVARKEPVS